MTSQQSSLEPFLDPVNKRNALFPIQYEDIWELYHKHQAAFWVASEVDLTNDINHWRNKLTDNERHFLKQVLAFFASSDFIVNENECKKGEEVTILEYLIFCRDKMAREDIHSESYANMLQAYVEDKEELEHLKNAVVTIPSVKAKKLWFDKYIHGTSWAMRELAGAIVEGIFFSSSFCAIFWFKKRGLMDGLCDYNELISRDEGLHCDGECLIYNKYVVNKLDPSVVETMIREAVDIECEFCSASLPVELIGMNSSEMQTYVKFVADRLSTILIGKKIYNVENPFSWMTLISLQSKTDFFAKRVNAYAKQKNLTNKSENQIKIEDDY